MSVTIKNNIVSSVSYFAYYVPGHSCDRSEGNFKDNVAHSSRAGWFSSMFDDDC